MKPGYPIVDPAGCEGSMVLTLARLGRVLERNCSQLSLAQYRLLALVKGGGDRASALAGHLDISRPTVTAVVDGLVERGLLERSAVAGDRRAYAISITSAGLAAVGDAETTMAAKLAGLLARTDDPARVRSGLVALGRALDEAVAERMAESPR
ncbi:MAG: MarR family winged helix-turn-helix transcriptional regulator [Acidimicrobiales bacterium]